MQETDNEKTTARPQPLELEPSQEPWRPRQGVLTRVAVWTILVVLGITLILMGVVAVVG